MVIGDDLRGILTSLANQEAAASGIDTLEQRATKARSIQDEALKRQRAEAEIAKLVGETGRAPEEFALKGRLTEAQIKNLGEPTGRQLTKEELEQRKAQTDQARADAELKRMQAQHPELFHPRREPVAKPEQYVQATDRTTGETVFAPKSELGGGKYGPLEPNVERVRKGQAGHVVEQAQALLKDYDSAEAKSSMGGLSGVLNEKRTTTPWATVLTGQAPPAFQRIKAAEASLSAFQPIMHGSRGGENMLEHFENNIRGNPAVGLEQRKAAVNALIEAAKRIQGHGADVDVSDLAAQVFSVGGQASPAKGTQATDVESLLKRHGF